MFNIIKSNPGGDWLERERNKAEKKEYPSGAITAVVTAKLPTSLLISVKGQMGEHGYVDKDLNSIQKISNMAKKMENGYNFPPVAIDVDVWGKPTVYEGNHRIRAAKKAGISFIPTEVRYLAGGEERAVDNFKIENLKKISENIKESKMQDILRCKSCGKTFEPKDDNTNPRCPDCRSRYVIKNNEPVNTMGKMFKISTGRETVDWSGLEEFQMEYGKSDVTDEPQAMEYGEREVFIRMMKAGLKEQEIGNKVFKIEDKMKEAIKDKEQFVIYNNWPTYSDKAVKKIVWQGLGYDDSKQGIGYFADTNPSENSFSMSDNESDIFKDMLSKNEKRRPVGSFRVFSIQSGQNESVKDDVEVTTKASDFKDLKTVDEIHAALVAKAGEKATDADKQDLKVLAQKYYQKKNESQDDFNIDNIIENILGGRQRFIESWIHDDSIKFSRIKSDFPERTDDEVFDMVDSLNNKYNEMLEEKISYFVPYTKQELQEGLDYLIDLYGVDDILEMFCTFKGCKKAIYDSENGFVYETDRGDYEEVSDKDLSDFIETFDDISNSEYTPEKFDTRGDYASKEIEY